MEYFNNAKAVRLRSHHGKYLLAEEDEESVTQDRNGSSRNAIWVVEVVSESPPIIRLKSCYGRYLTASNHLFLLGMSGRKVLQTLPKRLDSSVEWEPIREGSRVKLKTRYGNFLRANGGLPPWQNSVTHDIPHRTATQDWVLWDVDVVEIQAPIEGEAELEERFNNLVSQPIQFDVSTKIEEVDPRLLDSVKKGNAAAFIDELYYQSEKSERQPSSIILNQSTPSGNSLLHVAASSASVDIVKLLVQKFPILIDRANSQGDTALHASARAGNNTATIALVRYAQEHPGENLLKKKNKKGNTALHDAVIKRHGDVAESLIKADPIVAYMKNGEVKSPLYLAAQNGDRDMFHVILQAVSDDKYPTSMLEGKSPASAALENRNLDILGDMASMKPELIRHKDEKEDIPLHFASKLGFFEGVEFLLEKHRAGAFERNKKGHYPIHAACRKGHINIVNRLLKEWPDPMELLTNKGQNIVHVVAEKGREDMVDQLLKNPDVEKIVNEKDEDGNAALHLATKQGRSMAVFSLIKNNTVDWKIVNNDNMAPYEIVEQQIKKLDEEDKDDKIDTNEENKNTELKKQDQPDRVNYYEVMMVSAILHFHGSRPKRIIDYLRMQSKPLSKEELKSRIGNLLVVAILVASVTFAGAIQIPGGHRNDNASSRRNRIASKDDALVKAYVYLDVIALNASIMASLILCWAKITNHLVWLASILIGFSIYLMSLAFVIAAGIAMSENAVTFSVLVFVASILFLIQTMLCVPLIIPPVGSKVVEKVLSPYIYYGIFGFYYVFRKSLSKLPNHQKK